MRISDWSSDVCSSDLEDPERAAVGAGHQVAALHLQVVDRHHREAATHAGPRLAVVDAEEHPGLGADVEQAVAHRVGAQHPGYLVLREVADDRAPGLAAKIGRASCRERGCQYG